MRADTKPDRWWPAGPPAAAPARLLCLPYAGGGASAFRPWRAAASPMQVCPIQPPGRESRIREEPFRRMDALVGSLVEVLRASLVPPYALFGYSLGGLVAFELAAALVEAGLPAPAALFVAAAAAPHRRRDERQVHRLPDGAFLDALRELAGTPEEVLEHDELMDLMLPTLRADFELYETYRAEQSGARPRPLPVPLTAFGGTEDRTVPEPDLLAWGEVTSGPFRAVTFPAGHFFLGSHGEEMLANVRASLVPGAAPRGRTGPW